MKKGLTIIEIAIVLVVIGILIGVVVNGRTVVEAMYVKSELYKLRKIRAAYAAFVSKHNKLPGEVVNPEMFGATFDSTAYKTKEAMDELINEGLLKKSDFTINLLDGAYWNIMGCSGYAFQTGAWLDLPPNLSRNICMYPSTRKPEDDDKTEGASLATMYSSRKLICFIESHLDDEDIRSGLGRMPENTKRYKIDYTDCYSTMNESGIAYNYFFKVF